MFGETGFGQLPIGKQAVSSPQYSARCKLPVLIALLQLGSFTASSTCWSMIMVPFEDTMVIEFEPDSNFVSALSLKVAASRNFGEAVSLFLPDLSVIALDSVLSAVFEIVRIGPRNNVSGRASHRPTSLNPVLESWVPSEVTWRNRPSIGAPTLYPTFSHATLSGDSPERALQFDVTSLLNAWLANDGSSAFGFAMVSNAVNGYDHNVYGSLDGPEWSQPRLYITAVPEPGTHTLVALGCVVLSVSRRRKSLRKSCRRGSTRRADAPAGPWAWN